MTTSMEASNAVSPLASRYAGALFALASERGQAAAVNAGIAEVKAMLSESAALRAAIVQPRLSRAAMENAMQALAQKAQLPALVINFLRLLARAGRLSVLPSILQAFEETVAKDAGIFTAKVTAARPLSSAQEEALRKVLSAQAGHGTVRLDVSLDADLLGGLIVQLGSRRIDQSIKGRILRLQQQMREVA